MYTIFSNKRSRVAPLVFQDKLQLLLRYYQSLDCGLWMRSVPIAKLRFCFNILMTLLNGIMGAWSTLDKDNVYLMPSDAVLQVLNKLKPTELLLNTLKDWAYLIAPVAVHEIRHRWQRASYGPLKYLLFSIPIIRLFTILADADKITTLALKIILTKSASDTAKLYARTHINIDTVIPD